MDYKTTEIHKIKSYPTYQFYAHTASSERSVDEVFLICVLETLKWLRNRLKNFDELPPQLITPEPDKYNSFSEAGLSSFNINVGAAIDCTYIRDSGVWSLRITEPDAGENIGTETERLPVSGRTFRTEIAFIKQDDHVEVGVRTICSEPSDCTAGCSVFRPALVKAIAGNLKVGFINEGFRIDGSPLKVTNQTEFRNLEKLFEADSFDMPIVLAADSGFDDEDEQKDKPKIPALSFDINNITNVLRSGLSLRENKAEDRIDIPELSYSEEARTNINKHLSVIPSGRKKDDAADKETSEKDNTAPTVPEKQREKLPVFDYASLAIKQIGFSAVAFVSENCFDLIRNKLGISLNHGDIVVCSHGNEIRRCKYSPENISELFGELHAELKEMMKRGAYSFGNVMFYSDARLADLDEKRSRNMTLEDELKVCKQENAALKSKIKELDQQNTDMQLGAENNRLLRKQLNDANNEIDNLKLYIENYNAEAAKKESSYRKAADLIDFYRRKAEDAARFPTNIEDVCGWAAGKLSKNLIISSRAESALKKYSNPIDVSILCDALYYLNAYAEYRLGNIDEFTYSLYAQSYNWEISSSGKEAMKMYKQDYTAYIDGKPYLLDMHIRYGVSSRALIRVYFCWDEAMKKVVVGYMPGHLATVTQST